MSHEIAKTQKTRKTVKIRKKHRKITNLDIFSKIVKIITIKVVSKIHKIESKFKSKIVKKRAKMLEILKHISTLLIVYDTFRTQKNTNFYRKMHVTRKKHSQVQY